MPGAAHLHRRSVLGAGDSNPPPSITDEVAVWWAGDLSYPDTANVTAWTDRVGNVTLTNSETTTATYRLFGMNDKPTAELNSNGGLTVADTITTATSGCVVAVVDPNEVNQQGHIWSSSADAGVANRLSGAVWLNYLYYLENAGRSGGDAANLRSTSTISSGPVVYEWSSNGTTISMRIDNTSETVVVAQYANIGNWFGDVTRDNFTIGALKYNSLPPASAFDGQIAYLGVFDSELSAPDRTALYAWISSEYGITVA